MEGHHHSLISEFPEHRERIHELKVSNAHFRTLCERFEEIDKKIARSESRIDLHSEESEEHMKKDRLALKDEIYKILTVVS
jgi:uncharacterized protein YdcH (DUF465 family)